jgi:hypothetical protein
MGRRVWVGCATRDIDDGWLTVELPPVSWTAIALG